MAKKRAKKIKETKRNKTSPDILKGSAPQTSPSLIINRNYLILIAFFSGASIMIIELAANRVLAPWFGNTLYTWTGLIGVILVAISCGYYLGGWLVDRKPDCVVLGHLLMVSALLTLVVPLLQSTINISFMQKDIVWGPVFTSLFLFALPGCALGSIAPFVIRLISLLSVDKKIGVSAGSVGMFSTFGSVIGTFLAGFVLIPHMGIKIIFIAIGIVLSILSLMVYLSFFSKGKVLRIAVFLLLCLIVNVSISFSEKPPFVLFDKYTFYHRIRVIQKELPNGDRRRKLFLDTEEQGGYFEKSGELTAPYQKYWELVKLFCQKIKNVAFLGGGAYAMPEALLDAYPKAEVDVVELDPEVIKVGQLFFRVNEYPQMNMVADEARRYLRSGIKKYDLIFGDVYSGANYVPAHLLTLEFFDLVEKRLTKNGIFMINIASSINGRQADIFLSVAKTILKVFDNIYLFAMFPRHLQFRQNLIVVASNQELSLKIKGEFEKEEKNRINKLLETYISPNNYDVSNAPLITDNYNPIEFFVTKTLSDYVFDEDILY